MLLLCAGSHSPTPWLGNGEDMTVAICAELCNCQPPVLLILDVLD